MGWVLGGGNSKKQVKKRGKKLEKNLEKNWKKNWKKSKDFEWVLNKNSCAVFKNKVCLPQVLIPDIF